MQILTAMAWEQLCDLGGSPVDALTHEVHHLADLTETWLGRQEQRDMCLDAAQQIADRLGLLQNPPTPQPADNLTT
jgi:hypothetical protein